MEQTFVKLPDPTTVAHYVSPALSLEEKRRLLATLRSWEECLYALPVQLYNGNIQGGTAGPWVKHTRHSYACVVQNHKKCLFHLKIFENAGAKVRNILDLPISSGCKLTWCDVVDSREPMLCLTGYSHCLGVKPFDRSDLTGNFRKLLQTICGEWKCKFDIPDRGAVDLCARNISDAVSSDLSRSLPDNLTVRSQSSVETDKLGRTAYLKRGGLQTNRRRTQIPGLATTKQLFNRMIATKPQSTPKNQPSPARKQLRSQRLKASRGRTLSSALGTTKELFNRIMLTRPQSTPKEQHRPAKKQPRTGSEARPTRQPLRKSRTQTKEAAGPSTTMKSPGKKTTLSIHGAGLRPSKKRVSWRHTSSLRDTLGPEPGSTKKRPTRRFKKNPEAAQRAGPSPTKKKLKRRPKRSPTTNQGARPTSAKRPATRRSKVKPMIGEDVVGITPMSKRPSRAPKSRPGYNLNAVNGARRPVTSVSSRSSESVDSSVFVLGRQKV